MLHRRGRGRERDVHRGVECRSRIAPVGLNTRCVQVHYGHPLCTYGVICELARDLRCLQMLLLQCAGTCIKQPLGGRQGSSQPPHPTPKAYLHSTPAPCFHNPASLHPRRAPSSWVSAFPFDSAGSTLILDSSVMYFARRGCLVTRSYLPQNGTFPIFRS